MVGKEGARGAGRVGACDVPGFGVLSGGGAGGLWEEPTDADALVSRRGEPAREHGQRARPAHIALATRASHNALAHDPRSHRAASQRRSSPVFSRCFRRMAMRRLVDLVTIAGVHIVDRRGVTPARAGTSGEHRDSPLVEQQARRSAERRERSARLGRLPRRETIGERSKLDRSAKSRDIGSLPCRRERFSPSWSQVALGIPKERQWKDHLAEITFTLPTLAPPENRRCARQKTLPIVASLRPKRASAISDFRVPSFSFLIAKARIGSDFTTCRIPSPRRRFVWEAAVWFSAERKQQKKRSSWKWSRSY